MKKNFLLALVIFLSCISHASIIDNDKKPININSTSSSSSLSVSISSHVNVLCYGLSTGLSTASATGGTPPYSYVWSTLDTMSTISNLAAGTYTVTVTDSNGNTDTASVIISQPASLINITQQPTDDTSFVGSNTFFTVGTSGGPYDYQWKEIKDHFVLRNSAHGISSSYAFNTEVRNGKIYVATSAGVAISSDGGNTFSITQISSTVGTHHVKKIHTSTSRVYAATLQGLSISSGGGTSFVNRTTSHGLGSNICYSVFEDNGTIYVGTSYGLSISTDWGATFTNKTTSQGLGGLYCKEVFVKNGVIYVATTNGLSISTDGGNSFTNKTTANGLGNNSCNDVFESNGVLYVATDGGLSISSDGGNTFTNKTTANGLVHNDCNSVFVSNGAIYVATYRGAFISKDNGTTFTNVGLPSSRSYYDVYENNGVLYVGDAGGLNISKKEQEIVGATTDTLNLNNLSLAMDSSLYILEITDQGSGCYLQSDTVMLNVVIPPLDITINEDTSITCYGLSNGVISLSATGGTPPYSYVWSTLDTTTTISNVAAGTYTVTVTDFNGNTDTASVIISQPASLINITQQPTDDTSFVGSNTFFTVGTSGGPYDYQWKEIKDHFVLRNSAHGISSSYAFNTEVRNGKIYVATSAGVAISSDGGNTFSITQISSTVGTHHVKKIHTSTSRVYAATLQGLSISSGGGTSFVNRTTSHGLGSNICYSVFEDNGTIYVGTSYGLSISTDWGATFTNKTTSQGLGGLYCKEVFVKNGVIYVATTNGLSISTDGGNSFTNKTTANGLGNNSCNDVFESNGVLYVATDGGLSISSDGGNTFTNKTTANGLVHNDCNSVFVSNGAIYVATYRGAFISKDNGTTFTNVGLPSSRSYYDVYENNGVLYVGDAGGLNISKKEQEIVGATTDTLNLNNLSLAMDSSLYILEITDQGSGCYLQSDTVMLNVVIPPLDITINEDTSITCYGLSNGVISLSATGGTPPYSYVWSTLDTMSTISNVAAGTYTVTVTDFNGNTDTASVIINQPVTIVTTSILDSNVSCFGASNGGASVLVTGGTAPYSYDWSNTSTSTSITGVNAGTYSVSVTDTNGCTVTSSITITEPTALVAVSVVDSNVTCNGLSNGGASASAVGGTSPYSYSWNSSTTASITAVMAGSYTVTVMDSNGCSSTSVAIITEPDVLVASIVLDSNESCWNMMDGGLTVVNSGGTSPYSYIWSNGDTTASITGLTSGMFTVTITDINGCGDTKSMSIVHGLATANTISVTSCDSYTSPSGIYTWASSGTYMDTILNGVGCDSVLTINLTINYSSSSILTVTSCDSYTSPSGSFLWIISGSYTDIIPNTVGCDSVITVDLTITNSTDTTISVESCNSYLGISGNQIWTTSGTYTDVIPNSVGCDSVITINLTINSDTSIIQTETICKGESITVGANTYSISGTYVDTLQMVTTGCDSVVTTQLVVDEVDVSVSHVGVTLTADNPNGIYQWIDCDNNTPIAGETGQSFAATKNGNYAVEITENGCVDSSNCMPITQVGIIDFISSISVNVYPNPASKENNIVTIEVGEIGRYDLVIRGLTGKLIYSQEDVNTTIYRIDVTDFASGAFFIEIKKGGYSNYSRLIVM